MAGITGLNEFCDSLGLLTHTADDMGSVYLAFTHERGMVTCRTAPTPYLSGNETNTRT